MLFSQRGCFSLTLGSFTCAGTRTHAHTHTREHTRMHTCSHMPSPVCELGLGCGCCGLLRGVVKVMAERSQIPHPTFGPQPHPCSHFS